MKTELQLELSAFDPLREPACNCRPAANGYRLLCYRCPFSETKSGSLFCSRYARRIGARSKYGLPEWKRVRSEILLRDGNVCSICRSTEYLHVHHIDENATNDDPGNLVTLCDQCHAWIHSRHLPSLPLRDRTDIRTKELSASVPGTGNPDKSKKEF